MYVRARMRTVQELLDSEPQYTKDMLRVYSTLAAVSRIRVIAPSKMSDSCCEFCVLVLIVIV